MYGEDGWCHSCGTPFSEQTGHLTLQGSGFPTASVFIPNWQFNAICLDAATAQNVAARFNVSMREVRKPRSGGTGVQQLIPSVGKEPWYDPEELGRVVLERHRQYSGNSIGATCSACGRWRWLPVVEGDAPIRPQALSGDTDLIASPETFGDGWSTHRHLAVRRALAETLVSANPRTFSIREVFQT
ncbi:hypothetical protein [Nocardioides sp. WS12]|uniref:hypothetical protein n=1 Tax=Nocardioides sp. WS12 TaxID=2486272 RepID=UPI0015FA3308|nr:hypothetical protein [Nocardioides sp. WS12]